MKLPSGGDGMPLIFFPFSVFDQPAGRSAPFSVQVLRRFHAREPGAIVTRKSLMNQL